MSCAEDMAYAMHERGNAMGRGMVIADQFEAALQADPAVEFAALAGLGLSMGSGALPVQLFSSASHDRKQAISALVNFFVTHVTLVEQHGLTHSLLRWNATLPPEETGRAS